MTMFADYARNAVTDNPLLAVGAVVLLLVAGLWVARATLRSGKGPRIFARLVMLLALGWSAEVMFHIVRVDLAQGWGPTIAMFGVFEAAFLLAANRAERHMVEHQWPGFHLRTVVGIAVVMSCVGFLASQSGIEAFIRVAVPLVAVKIWRDGLYDGRESKPAASSWLWTPRNLAIYLGALRPGPKDDTEVSRERLIARMVRLEFKRQYGPEGRRDRYAQRLMRLSLRADDGIVREVRSRVGRAQWFTVTPLRNAARSSVRNAAQEPTQELAQISARKVTHDTPAAALADVPYVDGQRHDAAMRAAREYLAREFPSIRAAATHYGVSDGTVRNRLKAMDSAEREVAAA